PHDRAGGSMMRALRLALLGLVVATAGYSQALADPPTPESDYATVRLAKQYADMGIAAQEAHDYETAIKMFTKADRAVRHPLLIFDLAQAHRLAGHADKALALYQRYLTEEPDSAQAHIAREFVKTLLARQADKQRTAHAAERTPEHQPDDDSDAPAANPSD